MNWTNNTSAKGVRRAKSSFHTMISKAFATRGAGDATPCVNGNFLPPRHWVPPLALGHGPQRAWVPFRGSCGGQQRLCRRQPRPSSFSLLAAHSSANNGCSDLVVPSRTTSTKKGGRRLLILWPHRFPFRRCPSSLPFSGGVAIAFFVVLLSPRPLAAPEPSRFLLPALQEPPMGARVEKI